MTAVLLKILSPVECAAVAKFLRRTGTVAAMAKDLAGPGSDSGVANEDAGNPLASKPALSPDYCPTCGAGEFADERDRLTVDYAAGYGVIVPCPECAPERHAAYRQRVSQAQVDDGIERRDPWDVPESEQIHGGLTGAEMAAAEESYERGRIYYTSRGAVRGVSPRYRDDD